MDQHEVPPKMLDNVEQEQAAGVAPLRPHVIHKVVREEGDVEIRRSLHSLGWSGFAAGGSMGFSFLGSAMLRAGLPDAWWRHLVESLGYSVGFVMRCPKCQSTSIKEGPERTAQGYRRFRCLG